MVVEGADSEVGGVGDLGDRRLLESPLAEEARRVEQRARVRALRRSLRPGATLVSGFPLGIAAACTWP